MMQQIKEVLPTLPECPWYPQSGPQALAYISKADELFFGGAAGGGKTDLLVGLSLTAHIKSLLLRSESTQLTGVKERILAIKRNADHWQGVGSHGGILRTAEGRMVEIAGCRTWADANTKFRGRDHDLKLYDELPTIPKNVYTFINGWNRTVAPQQRCRVVSGGNPPARPEEEWVLDYWGEFLRSCTVRPGELVWYIKVDGEDRRVEDGSPVTYKKEVILPRSRTFIPSLLADNPILADTGYAQVLQNMPEPYKSQLLFGDMTIGLKDDAYQLIPSQWVELAQARWKPPEEANPAMLTCLACDPSRGGDDRTVIAKRYGQWIAPLSIFPGKMVADGPKVAQLILERMENLHAPGIIDITGTAGGGAYDSLQLIQPRGLWYAFVASGASSFHDKSGRIKMRNKRTEAYWRLREALDPTGKEPLSLPPGPEIKVELCAARWYIYTSGAGVEDKDEIIKRIGKSPDIADAIAMTFMDRDAPNEWLKISESRYEALPQRHAWK